VGIIRKGRLIALETVADLRSKSMRRIEFQFSSPVEASVFENVEGVRDIEVLRRRVMLSYDGKIDALLTTVAGKYDVIDITTHDADLEEIFLAYYREEGSA
jgi:ABC-2 type transport system ATP-binding protein